MIISNLKKIGPSMGNQTLVSCILGKNHATKCNIGQISDDYWSQ